MQAKQYLNKIKRLDSFAENVREEIEELEVRAENIGSLKLSKDKVQTSVNTDKLTNNVIRLVAQKQKYIKALNLLYEYKAEAEDRIQSINNDDYRLILIMRYLRFKTFGEIAVKMHISKQAAFKMHEKALCIFNKIHFQ